LAASEVQGWLSEGGLELCSADTNAFAGKPAPTGGVTGNPIGIPVR